MAKSNTFFNMDMLVLSILRTKDCYGYEISKKIKELSNGAISVKDGTLYPIVYNLMGKGFVTSRDEIHNKKIRVYYHLETAGEEYLEHTLEEFQKRIKGVFDIIAYGEENKSDI